MALQVVIKATEHDLRQYIGSQLDGSWMASQPTWLYEEGGSYVCGMTSFAIYGIRKCLSA